ncbi:MAG TPA: hypothetical protein VFW09_04550 [Solirubrobacteraceae bacterium]|nr:hypothetical protein [Solirubrobacteraceae bacterium]
MIGRWGISSHFGADVGTAPARRRLPFGAESSIADRTRQLIDDEVKRITDDCYAQAQAILTAHRAQLDRLAAELLRRDTLDEVDAYAAAGVELPAPEPTGDSAALAAAR